MLIAPSVDIVYTLYPKFLDSKLPCLTGEAHCQTSCDNSRNWLNFGSKRALALRLRVPVGSCEVSSEALIRHESAISRILKGDESMKTLRIVVFGLTLILGTVSAARADCPADGRMYPEGARKDGFIC